MFIPAGEHNLAFALRLHRVNPLTEVDMVTESVFFYFVLLSLLVVIANVLLTKAQQRHDRHSHV